MVVRTAKKDELQQVQRLLELAELPLDGVREHLEDFVVAEDAGKLVGTVGLEVYDAVGLLRSLAVDPSDQNTGLGARLVEAVLKKARERNLEAVYLLTTTAERYFPRFGFEPIAREAMDPRLGASKELQGVCPKTARCMRLAIDSSST
jgi:amino-acid N-acetyltransferase